MKTTSELVKPEKLPDCVLTIEKCDIFFLFSNSRN